MNKKQRIIALLTQDVPLAEDVARAVGCASNYVHMVARTCGLAVRKPTVKLDRQDMERIGVLRSTGHTLGYIAKELDFKVSRAAIHNACRKMEISKPQL